LVYVFEPEVWFIPLNMMLDIGGLFTNAFRMSIKTLKNFGAEIFIHYGGVIDFFKKIQLFAQIDTVFSHVETGIRITYERDMNVKKFFQDNGIKWIEYPQNGVLRGIKNRENWTEHWNQFVKAPIANPDFTNGEFFPFHEVAGMKGNEIPEEWKVSKSTNAGWRRNIGLEVYGLIFFRKGIEL
jgi:deoxyribodipyrimidine photo-lyase